MILLLEYKTNSYHSMFKLKWIAFMSLTSLFKYLVNRINELLIISYFHTQ